MTRQRNDSHSTEFGLWLRQQKEIDSSIGFITTNIDYIWENYKTNDWMLLEEKRYLRDLPFAQKGIFNRFYKRLKRDGKFHGFHLLQFEKTSPLDGKIYLDKKEITTLQLLSFLRFEGINDGKV